VSPRRNRDDLDLILAARGRKKKRAHRVRRRRRAGAVAATLAIAFVVVVLTLGLGTGVALSQSCDLNALRPVEIGQNSFVFADDGSILGSIPAERNREPVTIGQMSRWLPPARRRRLCRHRASRVEGRHRRQGPRRRLDDHAAARA